MTHLAEIRMWGELVGALVYQPDSRISVFEYAPKWRQSGIEIAPLKMPLGPQKYSFSALNFDTFKGLPGVFADALPDDFGHAVINAWLTRQGRDVDSFSPVERLLYTGTRGMGALEFLPMLQRDYSPADQLEMESLVAMAQKVLNQRAGLNQSLINEAEPEAMHAILQVGTSAGGARAKALIAINKERNVIRSGQVKAPEGFDQFLLKFDGVEEYKTDQETFGDPQGYGRMEYAYYLMAQAAGIDISYSELFIEGQRAHFMTQRFDRIGQHKCHYVSLCGMAHADYKQPGLFSYEELLSVARTLRLPRQDAIEIFRRMVFNVVARNHDDHTKNFGFLLKDRNAAWRLAPAFDVAYSYKPGSPWVNSHQMSLNGKRDGFERDDLLAVAQLIGNFGSANKIIDEVVEVVSDWHKFAKEVTVDGVFAENIYQNMRLTL